MRAITAILLVLAAPLALGQEIASCEDPEPWAQLEQLREKYAGTDAGNDVQFLINYRRFLCTESDSGRLPWPEGTRLFEEQRNRIIQEWKASNPQDAPPI